MTTAKDIDARYGVKIETMKDLRDAIASLEQAREAVSVKSGWTIAQKSAARSTIARKLAAIEAATTAYALVGEFLPDVDVVNNKGLAVKPSERRASLFKLMAAGHVTEAEQAELDLIAYRMERDTP